MSTTSYVQLYMLCIVQGYEDQSGSVYVHVCEDSVQGLRIILGVYSRNGMYVNSITAVPPHPEAGSRIFRNVGGSL